MDGENPEDIEEGQYRNFTAASPEIVEIGDESNKSTGGSRDVGASSDVYVAVGKNDLHVVKWALNHVVAPGGRLFLVHVFPRITYVSTPGDSWETIKTPAEQRTDAVLYKRRKQQEKTLVGKIHSTLQ